ncbi:N-acetyltransferase 9 [Tulasnella sp. 417]|nr:N-acetyltransferase 9 [Tulasnella sp. 417]
MTDPKLQELTASEPLSYEQEVEMQQLTFIILDRAPTNGGEAPQLCTEDICELRMIGDVNLFFNRTADEEGHDTLEVECEVMIAEPEYRGRGLGHAALSMLLSYASSPVPDGLGVPRSCFVAKIGLENLPSRALFRKLGFRETKVVEVFSEVELKYDTEATSHSEWLKGEKRVYD